MIKHVLKIDQYFSKNQKIVKSQMKILFLMICSFISMEIVAQSGHVLLRNGDSAYKKQDYSLAEEAYHKSLEKERDYKAAYNLGNALIQQERFEEAAGYYLESLGRMEDDITKSKAYHNLGISLFYQQKFDESIDAFKNGIKLNSSDSDIKDNLMMAKIAKKQMEEQEEPNEDQKGQEGEEGEEQQQENKEQQEGEPKDGEEEGQQNKEEQDQEEQQDSTQQQSQGSESDQKPEEMDSSQVMQAIKLTKEEAARLLQAAELEERKVQEKLRRVNSNSSKPTKDW